MRELPLVSRETSAKERRAVSYCAFTRGLIENPSNFVLEKYNMYLSSPRVRVPECLQVACLFFLSASVHFHVRTRVKRSHSARSVTFSPFVR